MNLIRADIVNNDCYQNNVRQADSRYTTFQHRGPLGGMLHSVGVGQSRAKLFVDGWNVPSKEVAVHAVLQADGTVYQCMPWNFRGWHCGGSGNNTHIGVEMTEPDSITYTSGASFTCSDLNGARAYVRKTYETAVELFARLAQEYGWNPDTDILSHTEGHARGVASGHADPEHLWRGLGLEYTMNTFRAAVKARIARQQLYRIRRSWENAASQVGAYSSREAAIAQCPPGYRVFDAAGSVVFYRLEEEEPMTRNEILQTLGDRYIERFADLPEWAKPEVRRLLDAGHLRGTDPDDPDDIGMLLSDIRTLIVAARLLGGTGA